MTTTFNPIFLDYPTLTYNQKLRNCLKYLPYKTRPYLFRLFPIIQWIGRYNLFWLVQDVIVGITVGMLIVPQGIAYAKIANLDPQYGLYTSFVGVTIYCIFGTSKDISIGPITIVSLLVGQAIEKVKVAHPEITGPEVAVCLSLFSGVVLSLIGLINLGMLVDFISEPAVAGYMTGSAITITLGQWPKLFGLSHVNTHTSPYLILVSFFRNLPNTSQPDVTFGLSALVILYAIKISSSFFSTRIPAIKKPLFFLGIMRSGLVVIFGTVISYLINRHRRDYPLVSIIQSVPTGFNAIAIPSINLTVLKETSDILPSIILILILEHISVAKSFGNLSNYTINPNQEILAIGISNIIGSFFGAYPCTGAFSRTAVMSKSGSKTPLAGVFAGAVVILALYVLTPAFFYIPEAVLGSVVIHAVIDLISGPAFLKLLWKSSKFEFLVFVLSVIMAIFVDVETAIYVSIGLSLCSMLYRLARPSVINMGRIKLVTSESVSLSPSMTETVCDSSETNSDTIDMMAQTKYVYINQNDPNFKHLLDPLPPGIVIVQLTHSLLYPNSNYVVEQIMDIVKYATRPGQPGNVAEENQSDLLWNEPSLNEKNQQLQNQKPYLDCLVIDLSAVSRFDATAIYSFHSLQKLLIKYLDGKKVELHFCHVCPEVRHILVKLGFVSTEQDVSSPSSAIESDAKSDCVVKIENVSFTEETCDTFSKVKNVNFRMNKEKYKKHHLVQLLPKDRYPNLHWDIESAVYSICILRQQK